MTTSAKFADFVAAQDPVYAAVLAELRAGRKHTHWIWFIFPQLLALGSSSMARKFGIASLEEARSYLAHEVLGPRLRECTNAMLALSRNNVTAILGSPDDLKFCSCMTLFAAAAPEEPLFEAALKKYFAGERDERTLQLLRANDPTRPA
jgi:uncharacterized protein (DUF1810 family)